MSEPVEYLRVRAHTKNYYNFLIELAIMQQFSNGEYAYGEVIMHPATKGMIVPTAIGLNINDAQILMDDLWNCGIRPTEGAGSAGAMAATVRHLEDMRRLVFKGEPK